MLTVFIAPSTTHSIISNSFSSILLKLNSLKILRIPEQLPVSSAIKLREKSHRRQLTSCGMKFAFGSLYYPCSTFQLPCTSASALTSDITRPLTVKRGITVCWSAMLRYLKLINRRCWQRPCWNACLLANWVETRVSRCKNCKFTLILSACGMRHERHQSHAM